MGNWIQTWLNVLTRPGEPVFEEERRKEGASLNTALIWIAIAGLVAGVVALLRGLLFASALSGAGGMSGILAQSGLPQEQIDQFASLMPALGGGVGISGFLFAVIGALIWFLILVGLFHLTARMLGGTGDFGRYAYQIAAFHAPISMVSAVLGLVPLVGGCLALILWIYEVVLAYFATRVEHGLPQGKAIITVLIPFILLAVVVSCLAILVGGALAAILNAGN